MKAMETHFERVCETTWCAFVKNSLCGFSGTSAGAVIALSVCLGHTSDVLEDVCANLMRDPAAVLARPDIRTLVDFYGLDHGHELRTAISLLLERAGISRDVTFCQLDKLTGSRFSCTATNLNTRRPVLFDADETPNMRIADAVFISCSVPLLFTPTTINGNYYVDGSITSDVPPVYLDCNTMYWTIPTTMNHDISGWRDYVCAVIESMAASIPSNYIADADHRCIVRCDLSNCSAPMGMDVAAAHDSTVYMRIGYESALTVLYDDICKFMHLLVLAVLECVLGM